MRISFFLIATSAHSDRVGYLLGTSLELPRQGKRPHQDKIQLPDMMTLQQKKLKHDETVLSK